MLNNFDEVNAARVGLDQRKKERKERKERKGSMGMGM